MRIKFVVLSVLMGCLALFLGLESGRSQNPGAPAAQIQQGRRFINFSNPVAPTGGAGEREPRTQAPPNPVPEPVSTTSGADEKGPRTQTSPRPAPEPGPPTDWADERFLRLDRDFDGYLRFDEMSPGLRAEGDRWDFNADGLIDLDEWREYVAAVLEYQRRLEAEAVARARNTGRNPPVQIPNQPPPIQFPNQPFPNQPPFQPGSPGGGPRGQGAPGAKRPPFDESRLPKAVAQRDAKGAPNLPSNIPVWFKDYDADGDGQIILHEWKDKGDTVREFKKYDLNGDAYVTVEELIRTGQFLAGTIRTTPPSVAGLRAEVGEFFYFEVTGANRGTVWGTDLYTADSPIGTAAVHAGVLQIGETAMVKVTVLAGEAQYQGTVRNGVRTNNYGPFARSYRVEMIPNK